MKLNDAVIGLVLVLFGAAVAWRARGFPTLPHQHYGAALFPMIIGSGLALCGLLLIASGLRSRAGSAWVRMGPWVRSPRHVISFLLMPLGLVAYILVSDQLGFFLTGTGLLALWLLWLRGRWLSSLLIALVTTLVIDIAFAHFLLVPLPWGVFQPLAWWQ